MVHTRRSHRPTDRTRILTLFAGVFLTLILVRLFSLQVLQNGFYKALAEGQHSLYEKLYPTRGKILVSEKDSSVFYSLATNEPLTLVYANPRRITEDRETIAEQLAPILEMDKDVLLERISKRQDQYEPLKHAVGGDVVEKIKAMNYAGIEFTDELVRLYPEGRYGSHLVGFLGFDGNSRKGQYGIEGAFEKELAGEVGHLAAERDAAGRWIAIGTRSFIPAVNGSDIVLTINRAIQHEACTQLDAAVEKHGADSGSIVVLDPKTGAVLAMCGAPDFDPNDYAKADDTSVYANPAIMNQYEPGSVFKPITMAAALDLGKITPQTSYTDSGSVKIGTFTIKNSDANAHGVQTMTQVLEQSLNTGAIYAMNQIGPRAFESYVQKFGFGKKTGIELQGDAPGNIASLKAGKEIFASTASYGQGITVTPLQLAAAYGAIANSGTLMKPYIVRQVLHADGSKDETLPEEVRSVMSARTATKLTAMLVNVVKNGHGARAGVAGYYIAGKTGTAQVAKPDGPGYLDSVNIGTFAGFGPVEDPKFVMVVRIDHPRDVQFAESTAAPLFGSIADFILHYFEVPPSTGESAG